MKNLVDKLRKNKNLSDDELLSLLNNMNEEISEYLRDNAHEVRMLNVGDGVFMRGLLEFTNYCSQNCMYCGIRASNKNAARYRLELDEILDCCKNGYMLGYRTFVLQGGEDLYYTDEKMIAIIKSIKERYPDCAVTLSIGEKSKETYKKYYEAGADRYLLRHETASKKLYDSLHPNMSFENRLNCHKELKEIGYQVGTGFMVGLPNQTNEDLVKDLRYIKNLQPHMVGMGPFIPHSDTELAKSEGGTVRETTILLSIIRLMLPEVLLPATTALGTLDGLGREKGLKAGANVVMPNLSPMGVRDKYSLYDGKICTGDEAAECRKCIEGRIQRAGFSIDMSRGDHKRWER
jgi:biotin synthase